jgi:hypothetical protein
MQNQQRFMLVSPAPGFSARVMSRIAERERARARQRALLGSALLIGAASAAVAFGVIQIASVLWILITNLRVVFAALDVFRVSAGWVGRVLEAFWIGARAVTGDLSPMPMVLGAATVFALTMLWVRVVTGSFHLSLTMNSAGGLRK